MRRLALAGLLLVEAALHAQAYRPPVQYGPKGRPSAWITKQMGVGTWCAFNKLAPAQEGLDVGDYDTENRVMIWHDRRRLNAIEISNENEDGSADDVYYLDAQQQITRMVRTGHSGEGPIFSVTFVPDWTRRLVLTPASKEVVRRMEQAELETEITDWPKYASFARMPFRNLIRLKPTVSIRPGCASAAD